MQALLSFSIILSIYFSPINDNVSKEIGEIEMHCKNTTYLNHIEKDQIDLILEIDSFPIQYSENAIIITESEEIIDRNINPSKFKKHNSSELTIEKTIRTFIANEIREIIYEIRESKNISDQHFMSLIIWKKIEDKRLIEFEFTAKATDHSIDLKTLDERRMLWMELCNAHDVEGLVTELYTENTMYYNHKPIVQGRQNLIKEYSYMNNEKYSLVLNPEIIQPVNDEYIFEIGQCEKGYNGKYILIWKKDTDGEWRIVIDSNI